ncbi:MAG: cytochrome c [Nitrospirae bacterium]|nr:cytochrome c [Nitrospirota bacterium]
MMRRILVMGLGLMVLYAGAGEALGEEGEKAASAAPAPKAFQKGESLYNGKCASCHGTRGVGTDQGPPFVSRIYEPNHHGDEAFQRAVQIGVRPHHWNFGPMPPVPGLNREETTAIIGYIRWFQRPAGIE